MAKVRIGDVAREAGVSLGTVSNALNHPDKVRPETLAAVDEAIERLGYVPNQAARQLAGSESRVFGLVLPRLDHAFSLQIANGAQAESRKHGYDLLIASAGNDDILENHYMRYFLGAHIAGVLVQPMAASSWEPPIEVAPIPTVYLDIHSDSFDNCIAADNEAQGRLMAEHAIACGAQKMTVVGDARFMQLSLRVRGVQQAVRAKAAEEADGLHGLEVELINRGDWNSAQDGYDLGRELAARPAAARPDFVLGLTDVLAAGVIEGLEAGGLRVPDDVLVAGCDGNPLAWSGSVPLTTIASPGYEIGRRGVAHLVAQIEGRKPCLASSGQVEPALLVRASTTVSESARKRADVPELNLGEYL